MSATQARQAAIRGVLGSYGIYPYDSGDSYGTPGFDILVDDLADLGIDGRLARLRAKLGIGRLRRAVPVRIAVLRATAWALVGAVTFGALNALAFHVTSSECPSARHGDTETPGAPDHTR